MRPTRPAGLVAALIALTALCACAASGTSTTATSSATQTSSASQAASASSSSSAAASPASPAVDLTLSGPLAVAAKGSAGQCQLGRDGSGTVNNFGFAATGADYPGLGDGLFVSEGNSGYVTVKLLGGSGGINTVPNAVSADHKSVSLDVDLSSGDVPEHIAGTISCP